MKNVANRSDRFKRAGIIALLAVFLFVTLPCKTNEQPEFEANIIATNESGATVDVFRNGILQFILSNNDSNIMEKVAMGTHSLEAKLTGTETVVFSDSLQIAASGDYVWIIQGPASIKVENQYGETLRILLDRVYLGDVADNESQTISSVPFGAHLLEAVKASDNTLAASLNLTVDEIKEYVWTITQ